MPSASNGAFDSVRGLFRSGVALGAAFVLWSTLTLSASLVESQVKDTAQRGIVAVSRVLGHMANTDNPLAERRPLVNRQPG
jgi:hypothetical protein